jgi:hypothetical protein
MKKVLFIALLALLFSCEKEKEVVTTGTVTFWTDEFSVVNSNMEGWLLWVDGIEIGVIKKPYEINSTNDIPVCGDGRFTSLQLSEGQHSYYLTCYIPKQPFPNYFVGQTYNFDVQLGGCVIVEATQ